MAQHTAMDAESLQQVNQLQLFKGCQVKFSLFSDSGVILLKCYPQAEVSSEMQDHTNSSIACFATNKYTLE